MELKILRISHLARRALEDLTKSDVEVGERGPDGLVEVLVPGPFAEALELRAKERGLSLSDFIVDFHREVKSVRPK